MKGQMLDTLNHICTHI